MYLRSIVPSTFTLQVPCCTFASAVLSESTSHQYCTVFPSPASTYSQYFLILDSFILSLGLAWPGLLTVTVTALPSSCHSSFNATYIALTATEQRYLILLVYSTKNPAVKSKPRVTKSWGPCCQTRDPLTRLLFHLAPAILDVPSNPCASWSCVAASDSPPARPELPLAIKEPTGPADQVDQGEEKPKPGKLQIGWAAFD